MKTKRKRKTKKKGNDYQPLQCQEETIERLGKKKQGKAYKKIPYVFY
jgi:hypothetical protein